MTEREIKLNYQQAIKQARKLEEIAGKLENLSSNKLSNTVGTLKQAWQSDSSPQYYNKVDKVQGDINTTAKQVRKIANSRCREKFRDESHRNSKNQKFSLIVQSVFTL